VGCTTGSREEVSVERKPVIRDGDDNYVPKWLPNLLTFGQMNIIFGTIKVPLSVRL